jgi:protoporphyrin/coproporphyrin ferrochelatase
VKIAVVLFNLGGPESPETVRPFLENLFSDPAIIGLPAPLRLPLAKLIAARRAPLARKIYDHIGGRSPILEETEAQAQALQTSLAAAGHDAKCIVAMRCWRPFTAEAVAAVKAFDPEEIVLLPLYPQYSTTTTKSSLEVWRKEAARAGLAQPQHEVCCYPFEPGFADAIADLTQQGFARAKPGFSYRVLFSAHGLPKRVIERGDPYRWQVERTVEAIAARLGDHGHDVAICYQSRVGPLEWIGPATDAEVRRAGAQGKGLIVVPIAFVSEHSETLVELDIEYGVKLAGEVGVPDFIRVSTVGTHPAFIAALASLVTTALNAKTPVTCAPERICPARYACERERRRPDV